MNEEKENQFDLVVLGSGLGGLICAAIYAKEGKKVCVLEKNKQIGGTLQAYSRDRVIFDSGVHYVGGLDKGQNLNKIFTYLGIIDKLKIHRLDDDTFDEICFEEDPITYKYAQGYENFIKSLTTQFPHDAEAIVKYCDTIQDICRKFPLYNLEEGDYMQTLHSLEIDTKAFIESITENKKLRKVLGGSNFLYAGEGDKTPLYVHALIFNHYVESSYRFVDGGSQIARELSKVITAFGGRVYKHAEVKRLVEVDGKISFAEIGDGRKFYAEMFISNIHPKQTMELLESKLIKPAYRHRLSNIENTISVFAINAVMKKDSFKYLNHNFYWWNVDDIWLGTKYPRDQWPLGYAMYFSCSSKTDKYADGVTVMTYMDMKDVEKWTETFNTVDKTLSRGDDYELWKKEAAEKLIKEVERRFPEFGNCIDKYYTMTPLTNRDYIGTDDGSLYGYVKDYKESLKTFISPRTKIPNLLLTGQNISLHGVLGVSITAINTCSMVFGMEYLLNKINNAQTTA